MARCESFGGSLPMVRIPPSIPHGTQALLPSKFCLLSPQKRARIVSRSGERSVRIHMDAHPMAPVPFQFSSPIFRTFPSKSNILEIRFSQLFSMKNGQYGLVAQLGERCVRIAEVEGSIPFESTKNGNRRGFYHGDFSFDHRNTTDRF